MVTTNEPPLYQPVGAALCLDFVDSIDRMTHKPWIEHLQGYADLCRWSEQSGSLPAARLRALARRSQTRAARAVFERAIELREACYRLFMALATQARPAGADLERINRELARALGQQRLEPIAQGYDLHWGGTDELDAPLWPIARSAAELLTMPGGPRVKRCASETCLWLFLDTTKNAQRRWCDMKVCGNRAKVRAHRRRAERKPREG